MENKSKKQVSTVGGILVILIAFIVGFFIFAGGAEENNQTPSQPAQSQSSVAQPKITQQNISTEVIDQIAGNLKDNHTKEEISKKFEQVFLIYNLDVTEKNYNLIGNLLIDARKDYKTDEFSLLNCAASKYAPGENLSQMILNCALTSAK